MTLCLADEALLQLWGCLVEGSVTNQSCKGGATDEAGMCLIKDMPLLCSK